MSGRHPPLLVLDANILIRAVLGKRVRELVLKHHRRVRFFAPDVAYADARKYLPPLLEKRGIAPGEALSLLDQLERSSCLWHPIFMVTHVDRRCNASP